MTLSALIKKGGLTGTMTATPATPATQETDKPVTVAPVATVAVAEQPGPLPELSPDEESNIRAWLAYIEETAPAIIAEVVDKCRNDLDACRYFLKRSKEVPEQVTASHSITCGKCVHFERITEPFRHPHLGHCAKGEPEAIAGLWDTDRRYCERFLPTPQQTNNDQPRPAKAKTKR
ncbi:MAG: hypothetical protein KJ558_04270 [Gammaproteobacteria bacterium]|nr:hypothetical protein [Gammaproteobacteria bacterium]MBU1654037.1 hypothetical protein [Gammaproteobacteria bacterium]MBU1959706.1 hypothetical protein [Gammaproteobacteria bacterium]